MDLSNYEVGDWIPDLGQYKKICELEVCRRPFAGRKNRNHCTDQCKTKKNNDKARIRRLLSKRFTSETFKANNVFLTLLKDKDNIHEVSKNELMKKGYYGGAPYKYLKDDRFRGQWKSIGSFAYRLKEDSEETIEFIYIKDEELWQ